MHTVRTINEIWGIWMECQGFIGGAEGGIWILSAPPLGFEKMHGCTHAPPHIPKTLLDPPPPLPEYLNETNSGWEWLVNGHQHEALSKSTFGRRIVHDKMCPLPV